LKTLLLLYDKYFSAFDRPYLASIVEVLKEVPALRGTSYLQVDYRADSRTVVSGFATLIPLQERTQVILDVRDRTFAVIKTLDSRATIRGRLTYERLYEPSVHDLECLAIGVEEVEEFPDLQHLLQTFRFERAKRTQVQ